MSLSGSRDEAMQTSDKKMFGDRVFEHLEVAGVERQRR